MIDASKPIGTLVEEIPGASQLMDELGFNYCCRGQSSLEDACQARLLDVETVVARLEALIDDPGAAPEPGWFGRPVEDLVKYLEGPRGISMLGTLPWLSDVVLIEHGPAHPELQIVQRLVHHLVVMLQGHLLKEERRLFPSLRQPQAPVSTALSAALVDIASDHEQVAELLRDLRAFTHGYKIPEGASARYRRLYRRLAALDHALRERLHLMNNVLLPTAMATCDASEEARRHLAGASAWWFR